MKELFDDCLLQWIYLMYNLAKRQVLAKFSIQILVV